ncbi:MAG: YbaB/EbfC family nucleoid-associated protein [Gammaproteobacteria bacterium]|nr:YbaB/EbfC family nucleoid-associated protein [Gammaproteobacteria bacterium]
MAEPLLDEIKSSIMDMQTRMQSTYADLSELKLIGESHDKTVRITMTATYTFEDIEFDERALQGGIKEFRWRIREAWKNLSERIQETTQSKTVELLQTMQIPDDIKNIEMEDEGAEGSGGIAGRLNSAPAGNPNSGT